MSQQHQCGIISSTYHSRAAGTKSSHAAPYAHTVVDVHGFLELLCHPVVTERFTAEMSGSGQGELTSRRARFSSLVFGQLLPSVYARGNIECLSI